MKTFNEFLKIKESVDPNYMPPKMAADYRREKPEKFYAAGEGNIESERSFNTREEAEAYRQRHNDFQGWEHFTKVKSTHDDDPLNLLDRQSK